jgi:hypothetical protein
VAADVSRRLGCADDAPVIAAWLHDIGYGPHVVSTGFHPLDGARYVAAQGFEPEVARLVAFHSGAQNEAAARGLADVLSAEFARPDASLLAIVTYSDMRIGPRGEDVTIDDRLVDIRSRYGPEHVVTRSIAASEAELRAAVAQVESWLSEAQSQ